MHVPKLIRPEPVIHALLPLVAQHSVSFTYFLKSPLCLFVFWISVWMVLEGEFSISLLDLLLGGVTMHTQNAVIVSFVHLLIPMSQSGKRPWDLAPHFYTLFLLL